MGLISGLQELDYKLSTWLHRKDNIPMSALLYIPAAFFHPWLIWIGYLLVYHFSNQNIKFTLLYALATLISVIATTILKRNFKRLRPQLNLQMGKPHHFRKRQGNCSMPSGDAFQAAVFVVFMHSLNVNLWPLLVFHVLVCAGRVYYMCHWVGDTVVSSFVGVIMAYLILALEETVLFQTASDTIIDTLL